MVSPVRDSAPVPEASRLDGSEQAKSATAYGVDSMVHPDPELVEDVGFDANGGRSLGSIAGDRVSAPVFRLKGIAQGVSYSEAFGFDFVGSPIPSGEQISVPNSVKPVLDFIYQVLSTSDLKQCSRLCPRPLLVEGQSSQSLSLKAHSDIVPMKHMGTVTFSKSVSSENLHMERTSECTNLGLVSVASNCKLLSKLHIDGWRQIKSVMRGLGFSAIMIRFGVFTEVSSPLGLSTPVGIWISQ